MLSGPLLAAQPSNTETVIPPTAALPASAGATCRDDLKTFDAAMAKDGYWHPADGYGFGYPMGDGGIGMYGAGVAQDPVVFAGLGHHSVRPGHEVQVLVRAANILARNGQQQTCEDVLTVTRGLYKTFLTDAQSGGKPKPDVPDWRERQISAALPVTGANMAFRSDELLGVQVRSPNNLALGSVDDMVLSPQTGKIAYLVIARGGVFGFDESHVPVPWADFKATPNGGLLVLDTTKSALDGAPIVKAETFSVGGDVEGESQKVDAYWKAHQPPKASN
jgi:sporulation protein YlmC with PRC-barrel domain